MSRSERPARFFESISNKIWKAPRLWFLATVLICGFLIFGITKLRFELDYSRFYTEDSPVTAFFETFQEQFSGDPQAIWVMPETPDHAFHPNTISSLRKLESAFDVLEGVEEVISIANTELPVRDAFGYRTERLVYGDSISEFDSSRVMNLPILKNQLVSSDGRYPALIVRFDETYPKDSIYVQLKVIDQILARDFEAWHLAGRYWGEVQYNDMLQEETLRGILGSIVVLILMLWLLFRRVGSILLPAVAILTGVLAFFGLKGWADWPIDLLGVLFPPLLLIVGLSDVVHLYAKVQWKLYTGHSLKESIREAWKETGYATFLTSLTTGIGFMSLLTTKILPIRNFGWEAAWGVLLMFAVCIVVIPIFLRISKKQWLLPKPASNETWINLGERTYRLARGKMGVPIVIVGLLIVLGFGASRVETGVENYWQIHPESTLKSDLDFFDEHFGGGRYLDIGIQNSDETYIGSVDDYRSIAELTNFLRNHPSVGSVVSATDVPSALEMARFGGMPTYFGLADSDAQLESDLDLWYEQDSVSYHQFSSFDGKWLRISARLDNLKSDSAISIQNSIISKLAEINPKYQIQFTGNSVLMDTTTEMLVGSMFESLALAFGIIAILMGLLFRSLRMLIISLLPNILPLIVALALIGVLNIPLGTSTALILTIGFVIAVDDTIHYLMKFRLTYLETEDLDKSVRETNVQVGRALVLSSSVMLAAFLPQFFSSFLEQFYFAVVTSGVIVSALVADLILLPWLLLWIFKRK